MKLKAIFASFIAAAAAFMAVSCQDELTISSIEGLTVSTDYITISAGEGETPGTATLTVTAGEDWTISIPEKADWLTASPATGNAGVETIVTLTADPNTGAPRSTEIYIVLGSAKRVINVNQKAQEGVETPESTCKDVIDGDSDKTYKITGTIVKITNNHYGNFWMNDGTAEGDGVYIYGTNDKMGQKNNSSNTWDNLNDPNYENSWDLAVGDVITVQGPKTVYNGTVELVDVDVISVQKSLIDVAPFDFEKIPAEGGDFEMVVSSKAEPLLVSSDVAWLQIVDVKEGGIYVLHADANDYTAVRTATVTIKAPGALKAVSIEQEGIPATGATVTEIIAMADDSLVETLESTVIAKTGRGIVVWDGNTALYVYDKEKFAETRIGDNVKVFGKKTTYNGVPEITEVTEIKTFSSGNAFEVPSPTDITAGAGEYNADKAEYIKLTGTLVKSGNYYNLSLDAFPEGEKQGSINYPVEDLGIDAFVDKKITVTGWFNGLGSGGKFINMIATKVVEAVDNPKGTATNPYTASEMAAVILGGNVPEEDVYVKGIVSAVLYTASADYPTATFWLSDDGTAYGVTENKKSTTEPTKDFECYSVYWFGNQPWAEGNGQVTVGDEVIVCGKTTVYNGVAETASKKAWLYSVNYVKTAGVGLGSTEFPFKVAGAEEVIDFQQAEIAAAKEAEAAEPVFKDVCVGGKISAILYNPSASYPTCTFWISDDGTAYGVSDDKKTTTEPTKDFECYSVKWFGNTDWTEGSVMPAVGDDVVVKGQLTLYKGTYETASKKAWIYSLNGATE